MVLPKSQGKFGAYGLEITMPLFEPFSADTLILAFIATVALREAMLAYLPASVVGPHGWLLQIDERDSA